MDFDFSDELKQLSTEAHKFLKGERAREQTKAMLDGAPYDTSLWRAMASLGWLGVSVDEQFGGSGIGRLGVCLLAEQIGYAAAPTPFSSSVYYAIEAVDRWGSDQQKASWLPGLADGTMVGTFAGAETVEGVAPSAISASVCKGRLSGTKIAVADAGLADMAVVVAQSDTGCFLHIVDLRHPSVCMEPIHTLDAARPHQRVVFDASPAQPLDASAALGWDAVAGLLDVAAVYTAFEQIGVAKAALDLARDYCLQRYAFGRSVGSFQAIKHKLADVFVSVELARSCAYYGAWALSTGAQELRKAACMARVAATQAAWHATKESVQAHGGVGYTWEYDCHLYYRRARLLASSLGSARDWKARLMDEVLPRTGHAIVQRNHA